LRADQPPLASARPGLIDFVQGHTVTPVRGTSNGFRSGRARQTASTAQLYKINEAHNISKAAFTRDLQAPEVNAQSGLTAEYGCDRDPPQRSTAQVLSAIYEQDFLPCSFGGRPGRGAHHAMATLNEVIAGSKIGWVLEADLKNFFGSLSHEWLLRFVEHQVGDPRLIRACQEINAQSGG